jgi:alpha-glucoside transport system substrate-binding protein
VSDHSKAPMSRAIAILFAALLTLAACSGNNAGSASAAGSVPTGHIGGEMTVTTAWAGEELKAFQNVLKPFQEKTGIKVNLTTDRNAQTALANNKRAGTKLPDVATVPTPDKIEEWSTDGTIKPLEDLFDKATMDAYLANTLPGLLNIWVFNGKHYALMIKSQLKGLMWYNTKVFTGDPPKTYDELLAIQPPSGAKLFCAAFESGADSGWPASDMFANIVMRQSGPDVYTNWYNGKVKWSSNEIKSAFQMLGKMVAPDKVYGGTNTVVSTAFQRGGKPLFASPPGCMFYEQATFVTSFFKEDYPKLKPVDDFSFFLDPGINPQFDGNVEGFWDSMAIYNDTPQSRALAAYMVTPEAQQTFVNGGSTLASNKNITTFPDPVLKHAAELAASAKNFLPTAGDQMPDEMKRAFWRGLLDFTKDQSKLDSILKNLDQVQASAYAE